MAVSIDPLKTGTSDEVNPTFTTLTVSGDVTLTGGTANGVAYLNGSKVLTTGSALTFDGANLLIGQTSNPNGVRLALGGNAVAGLPAAQNATFRGFKFGITDVVGDFGGVQMNLDSGELRYTAGYGGYGGFHTWYANGSQIGAWGSAGVAVTGSISAGGTIKAYAGQFIAQESAPPPGKRVSVSVVGDNYGDMYAFDATAVAAIPLVMQRLGGNVLIGSTTDNGSKLQVTGSISATDFIAGAEQTAPAAPAANGYRIFAQDNGAGKTQLMVIFASGAAQQIAIEP